MVGDAGETAVGVALGASGAGTVTEWIAQLADSRTDVPAAQLIDQLRALEALKGAAAAAQARISVALDEVQRVAEATAGVPRAQQGRGVAGQVALARRESAFRGAAHLGLAKVLVAEMPHTLAALTRGVISEWRATLLARETACLSLQHRQEIDTRLAGDPETLQSWGDRRLVAEIRTLAYELDTASVVRRHARAAADRRVTCRPAPDAMALLSATLPVADGVAVYAALRRAADSHVATGDPRTRGQLMADLLVARVTGQAETTAAPVEIQVIMTDRALLGDGDDASDDSPAHVAGFGPIPAALARRLVVSAATAEAAWLRRLYTGPDGSELLAMDSTRRTFPSGLARFISIRDQFCRTPWCDAPIRHTDHALPHHQGGATSAANGQGLCQQCNHNRQAPGWHARRHPGPRHTLAITTPTGHTYITTAPHPPGANSRTRRRGPRRRTATVARSRRPRPPGARRPWP